MLISWTDCEENPVAYFAEFFDGSDLIQSLQDLLKEELPLDQRVLVWDALFDRDAFKLAEDSYSFMRSYWRNGEVKSLPEASAISRAMQKRTHGTPDQKVVKKAFPTNPRAATSFANVMGDRFLDDASGELVLGSALDLYGIKGVKPRRKPDSYLSLDNAMKIVHSKEFKNPFQYAKYLANGKGNPGLPANPPIYYRHEKLNLTWSEYLGID